MPAARYWRLVAIEAHGGADLELSALHLYDATGRADGTATLSSTIAPTAGQLSALQDADLASTCLFAAASLRAGGFAIVWDLGAGNSADILSPRLAGPAPATFLASCTLQRSDDGALWQTTNVLLLGWPGAGAYAEVFYEEGGQAFQPTLQTYGADSPTIFTNISGTNTTPSGAYAAWAAELGVSATATVQVLDEDDAGFAIDIASAFFPGGSTKALFSSEGAVGFYKSAPASTRRQVYSISNISRMVGLETRPTLLLSFHPQADLKSFGVKLQRANGVTILYAQHSSYFNDAAYRYNVAIRIGVNGDMELVGQAVDQSVSLYLTELNESNTDIVLQQKLAIQQPAGTTVRMLVRARPNGNFPYARSIRRTTPGGALVAASAPVPPHSTLSAPRLLTARNVEFAGSGTASATGTIYGSTAIKGSPNSPVRAKVSLLRARDLLLVQQTWSDPTTGAYAFHGLDPFEKYTTLAEYPTGDYRAVAADQLTPDIEEARAP